MGKTQAVGFGGVDAFAGEHQAQGHAGGQAAVEERSRQRGEDAEIDFWEAKFGVFACEECVAEGGQLAAAAQRQALDQRDSWDGCGGKFGKGAILVLDGGYHFGVFAGQVIAHVDAR